MLVSCDLNLLAVVQLAYGDKCVSLFAVSVPPPDTCISSLLEAALSGNEEQKPFECTLRPDLSVLVDVALGSLKEPANSLWINMQDYAISKGLLVAALHEFGLVSVLETSV